jgi:hypothetical protein
VHPYCGGRDRAGYLNFKRPDANILRVLQYDDSDSCCQSFRTATNFIPTSKFKPWYNNKRASHSHMEKPLKLQLYTTWATKSSSHQHSCDTNSEPSRSQNRQAHSSRQIHRQSMETDCQDHHNHLLQQPGRSAPSRRQNMLFRRISLSVHITPWQHNASEELPNHGAPITKFASKRKQNSIADDDVCIHCQGTNGSSHLFAWITEYSDVE